MAQSQREILDFSPFGFAAKADASGVDLKVPPLRSVRMTRDVWVNYYIIAKTKSRARKDATFNIFCHFERSEKSRRVLRGIPHFTRDDRSAVLLLNKHLLTIYNIEARSGDSINAATEEVEDALHGRSSHLDVLNTQEGIVLALNITLLHEFE